MSTQEAVKHARRKGAVKALAWMAQGLDPRTDSYDHLPSSDDEQYFAWESPCEMGGKWRDLPPDVQDAFHSGARAAFEVVGVLRRVESLDSSVSMLRALFTTD